MKALKKNAKNTQAIETQDLAQALADWYNNLACKVEFAVQRRSECPAITTLKFPAWTDYWEGTGKERLTPKNEDLCVAQFRYRITRTKIKLEFRKKFE